MKALGTLVAASLLVLTACGDKEPEVQLDDLVPDATVEPISELTFDGATWDGWEPVYGAMRPADAAAVAEISRRVTDLNASSWTAHESTTDSEIAYTPEHVRLRSDHLDLHLDPGEDVYDAVVTACTEEECSELDRSDDVDTEAEELADALPTPYFVLPMQRDLVDEIQEPLDEGVSAISTVDSPSGPVDCLVVAEAQGGLDALVGKPLVLESDGEDGSFVGWCVDPRGLVLADHDEYRQVPLYDAWRPGVDQDTTELVPAPDVTEAPVDPAGDYEDVVWAGWAGEYDGVRPATNADVTRLRDRVEALNATSWTAVGTVYGATMSVTPSHAKVDLGFAEWHFDTAGPPAEATYVVCLDEEEQCVRVGRDADAGDSPHLFNNDLDSMTFTWLGALGTQRSDQQPSYDEPPLLATVDSPVGPVDCLLAGFDPAEVESGSLESLVDEVDDASVVCIDQRGLVQVGTGSILGPQGQYTSWHAGVDDDVDAIPYRVRDYND